MSRSWHRTRSSSASFARRAATGTYARSFWPGPALGPAILCLAGVFVAGCNMGDEPARLHTTEPAPVPSGSVTVDARQPLLPTFPCSRCHIPGQANTQERQLTVFHTQKVLNHGTQTGWCYRCHSKDTVDKLHLADGTLVSFNEAYELCGSCHGDKLRDWKAGIHGLTTGYWLGERQRRSCPACHDPHQPRFPLMTAEHAPALPRTVSAPPHGKASGEHAKTAGEHHE